MKIVVKPFRNSSETLNTQNQIILRTFKYWPKFLVPYKENTCIHQRGKTIF